MKFDSNEHLKNYLHFNSGLEELEIDNSPNVTELPPLPASVQYLRAYKSGIKIWGSLHESNLRSFVVIDCPDTSYIPSLPPECTDVILRGLPRVFWLPPVTENCTYYVVEGLPRVQSPPDGLRDEACVHMNKPIGSSRKQRLSGSVSGVQLLTRPLAATSGKSRR